MGLERGLFVMGLAWENSISIPWPIRCYRYSHHGLYYGIFMKVQRVESCVKGCSSSACAGNPSPCGCGGGPPGQSSMSVLKWTLVPSALNRCSSSTSSDCACSKVPVMDSSTQYQIKSFSYLSFLTGLKNANSW